MGGLRQGQQKQPVEALPRASDCEYAMEHGAALGVVQRAAEFVRLFARNPSLADSEILDAGWTDHDCRAGEERRPVRSP